MSNIRRQQNVDRSRLVALVETLKDWRDTIEAWKEAVLSWRSATDDRLDTLEAQAVQGANKLQDHEARLTTLEGG